jgi:hypothetical protein
VILKWQKRHLDTSRHFGFKKKVKIHKNSVKKKKRFEKKSIFVDSRPKTIFGGHLEFKRPFIFWILYKIHTIHVKHIIKVFYPTGRFFPTLALLLLPGLPHFKNSINGQKNKNRTKLQEN